MPIWPPTLPHYIYHYNHYEPTALKRLASRYAVAEHQLDGLLRADKFVDLYKVVREATRVSEPSYSLKNLETFYMPDRQGDVATAGDSIVVYNRWRLTGEQKLLDDIATYNEVDCRSTAGLRDWLLTLRPESPVWFGDAAEPDVSEPDTDKSDKNRRSGKLFMPTTKRGSRKVPAAKTTTGCTLPTCSASTTARPSRSGGSSSPARIGSRTNCSMTPNASPGWNKSAKPVPVKRSLLYTFRFPPQETKLRAGDQVFNVANARLRWHHRESRRGQDRSSDQKRYGKSGPLPERLSVGPRGPISTTALREALYRFAADVLAGEDRYPAILRDILAKPHPRIVGHAAGEPLAYGDDLLDAATEAVAGLDQSYLFIQGPPGAGKTYTSAHVIVELIRRGKQVGVAANSHKAIHNLLDKIEEMADRSRAVKFRRHQESVAAKISDFDGKFIRSVRQQQKM